MHDFTCPRKRLYRSLWQVHFQLLQKAGSRIFPEWRTVFYELPAFLQETHWLPETLVQLEGLSFQDIRSIPLTFGTAALVTAERPRS